MVTFYYENSTVVLSESVFFTVGHVSIGKSQCRRDVLQKKWQYACAYENEIDFPRGKNSVNNFFFSRLFSHERSHKVNLLLQPWQAWIKNMCTIVTHWAKCSPSKLHFVHHLCTCVTLPPEMSRNTECDNFQSAAQKYWFLVFIKIRCFRHFSVWKHYF